MNDSIDFAEKISNAFKLKADHNKNESLISFILILVCSLLAPLFISFGEGSFWGKIFPSILSIVTAGLTSWLQLRKPQKLWSLYRNAQRHIEDNKIKHKFKIGDYKESTTPDSLLAENVALIALNAHNEWTSVVPTPEALSINERKNNDG